MILTQTRYAGNVTEIGTGSSWADLANLAASDGAYASNVMCLTTYELCKSLLCQGFDFDLPDNAIITGYELGVSGYTDWPDPGSHEWPFLSLAQLTITDEAGAIAGASFSPTTGRFVGTENEVLGTGDNSGGVTGLNGDSWTPTDINGAGFGVYLSNIDPYGVRGGWNLFWNYVRLTITYRIPAPCNQVIMF